MRFSFPDLAVHALTNAFIAVTLFWMIFSDAEIANPVRRHFIPKLTPIFIWLGLHATWTMFSPDPPMATMWPKVRMTTVDGDTVEWEPTPPARLSVIEKIRYKKFYKYYVDVALPGTAFHTKRDFAEYLLRRLPHGRHVVKVEVFAVFTRTPPLEARPREDTIYKSRVFVFRPEASRAAS